ncbi:hypothetical protein LEN26_001120 [Aphanomyces euteiches]|nr:hypothetical protein LEN26_001120 [Aphanomyces euteiches]
MANQDRQGLLDMIHEMDIELRQAARAGLLLLEKNRSGSTSGQTHDLAQVQRREPTMEVETLRQQRKTAILEVNTAYTRIMRLEHQLRHDRAAHQAVEQASRAEMEALQLELIQAHKSHHAPALAPNTKEETEEDDPRLALLRVLSCRLEAMPILDRPPRFLLLYYFVSCLVDLKQCRPSFNGKSRCSLRSSETSLLNMKCFVVSSERSKKLTKKRRKLEKDAVSLARW